MRTLTPEQLRLFRKRRRIATINVFLHGLFHWDMQQMKDCRGMAGVLALVSLYPEGIAKDDLIATLYDLEKQGV